MNVTTPTPIRPPASISPSHSPCTPPPPFSCLYFARPQSRYFAVDRIARDQVESYAARTGMTIAEVERRLAPNLAYDP